MKNITCGVTSKSKIIETKIGKLTASRRYKKSPISMPGLHGPNGFHSHAIKSQMLCMKAAPKKTIP